MVLREASTTDIPQMQIVRRSVKENRLSHPAKIKDADYIPYLTSRGKGWVCEEHGEVLGFAIVDLQDKNVWALFVRPTEHGRGIGKALHWLMLYWYFQQTSEPIWLSTAPNTRAARFYRMHGWKETGPHGKDEIRMEIDADAWDRIA